MEDKERINTVMLKKLILFIVVGLVFASSAFGDVNGPVYENLWMIKSPGTPHVADLSNLNQTTDRVRRNQTVYFVFDKKVGGGGSWYVVRDGNLDTACVFNDSSNGCTTAPLYISSEGATACIDSDDTDTASNNATIQSYTCMVGESGCLNTNAVWNRDINFIEPGSAGKCAEVNGTGINIKRRPAGGTWVYFDLTSEPTDNTVVIWVTGY